MAIQHDEVKNTLIQIYGLAGFLIVHSSEGWMYRRSIRTIVFFRALFDSFFFCMAIDNSNCVWCDDTIQLAQAKQYFSELFIDSFWYVKINTFHRLLPIRPNIYYY